MEEIPDASATTVANAAAKTNTVRKFIIPSFSVIPTPAYALFAIKL